MTGKRLLALALALMLVLLVLAGCAKKPDDILGMVGETPIYRWYYEANLTKQLASYKTYTGIDLTQAQYKDKLAEYKVKQLNNVVIELAIQEAARKEGLFSLTAEQEHEVDDLYLKYYNQTMAAFLEQYGSDANGRRKAEQAYIDLLAKSSLTPERMREMLRDGYAVKLLMNKLSPPEPVTEESIRAYYDEQLKVQQEGNAQDPNWIGENLPDIVLDAPEDFVETVRIMLKFTDKQMTALKSAAEAMVKAQQAYEKDKNALLAGIKKNTYDRAQVNYDNTLSAAYAELEQKLLPIREQALAGADFIKLLEQYSEDTHMVSYYVGKASTHVDEAYRDASLALANVGEVSAPVHLYKDGGVCLIMLKDKIPAGVRAFEDVHDQIKELLDKNRGENATLLNKKMEYARQAEEDGIVTLYPERI